MYQTIVIIWEPLRISVDWATTQMIALHEDPEFKHDSYLCIEHPSSITSTIGTLGLHSTVDEWWKDHATLTEAQSHDDAITKAASGKDRLFDVITHGNTEDLEALHKEISTELEGKESS